MRRFDGGTVGRLVGALLLAASGAAAQTPAQVRTLTLQDAIAMAQEKGPQAEVARQARESARQHDRAFNARLLPQLFLSGNAANYNHGISPITLPDGSSQFVGQAQNQSTLGVGFSQALPLTGGTVSILSQASRLDQFGAINTSSWSTTPVILQVQQGLFQPRKVVWQEREQSLATTVAERGYLEAREDVAATIAAAFFDLYSAQVSLANAEANVAVNDTLYTLNKGRFDVGKIGENDLLQSELALLRARAAVEDAKIVRDRSEAALRRQIDFPAGDSLRIVTPDSIPVVNADPEVAVREALKNGSTIPQNDLATVQGNQNLTTARLSNQFNATLGASVGFNQTAPVFAQAYQSPLAKQTLSLYVNLPMLQWGAGSGDVQAAKADLKQTAASNKIRRDALAEDARFSVLQLAEAARSVAISAKGDTVAEKRFTVAEERYLIGKITNTELFTGQSDKDAAVLAYVAALRAYWVAYYHLRRVTLFDFQTGRPIEG